jgi:hypothetical protein
VLSSLGWIDNSHICSGECYVAKPELDVITLLLGLQRHCVYLPPWTFAASLIPALIMASTSNALFLSIACITMGSIPGNFGFSRMSQLNIPFFDLRVCYIGIVQIFERASAKKVVLISLVLG